MPEPAPSAWMQLPADAQRFLSGNRAAAVINLWFEDDGSLACSPEQAGERLGLLLLEVGSYPDAIKCACEFTASLCRRSA